VRCGRLSTRSKLTKGKAVAEGPYSRFPLMCRRHPRNRLDDCEACEAEAERRAAAADDRAGDEREADAAADRYERWLESCWP
jgi:hypothetical protein